MVNHYSQKSIQLYVPLGGALAFQRVPVLILFSSICNALSFRVLVLHVIKSTRRPDKAEPPSGACLNLSLFGQKHSSQYEIKIKGSVGGAHPAHSLKRGIQ